MKRALETVNFVRSAKVVFLALGLIFGVTLVITGLTHTRTVGLFQKEADVLWPLVGYGATLVESVVVLYVVLSWMEQTLLALVMIADPAARKPNLVLKGKADFDKHTNQALNLGNGA